MVIPAGVVVLTDRRLAAGPLLRVVEAAISGGADWVILRERDLRYAERRALAEALRLLLPPGHLIVAGPDPLGGDAVHLAAADPPVDQRRPDQRPPDRPWPDQSRADGSRAGQLRADQLEAGVADRGFGRPGIVGRSCHDVGEVRRLCGEDYVTLSPVYPTATKPGYGPPLTARGAARAAGGVPWLALGGVDSPERAAECASVGAAGVAVLGAVMRARDPAAVTRELAEAFAVGQGVGFAGGVTGLGVRGGMAGPPGGAAADLVGGAG